MPMHPLWQIRQIVTVGKDQHVDRCNNFGNRAGGAIFTSFAHLVVWIAVFIILIIDLLSYCDDNFLWEFEDCMVVYEPYNKLMPARQVRLLQLWDYLNILHEERKQVFGSPLTIIGFDVDPNQMTVTMPDQSHDDLISAIRKFAVVGSRRPLRKFQSLAGWINWALNVYPLLRPGLSALYAKIAGKTHARELVWVSVALVCELTWLANHIESSTGIHFLDSVAWDANDTDFIAFCDACPLGLAFWLPRSAVGFQYQVTSSPLHPDSIFFLEALAIVSAIYHASNLTQPSPRHLAIFTDNMNCVNMFSSLHAKPYYNPLLLTTIDLILSMSSCFRVFHIPGHRNRVADALSRFENTSARELVPGLSIASFQPPRLTLGAAQK